MLVTAVRSRSHVELRILHSEEKFCLNFCWGETVFPPPHARQREGCPPPRATMWKEVRLLIGLQGPVVPCCNYLIGPVTYRPLQATDSLSEVHPGYHMSPSHRPSCGPSIEPSVGKRTRMFTSCGLSTCNDWCFESCQVDVCGCATMT